MQLYIKVYIGWLPIILAGLALLLTACSDTSSSNQPSFTATAIPKVSPAFTATAIPNSTIINAPTLASTPATTLATNTAPAQAPSTTSALSATAVAPTTMAASAKTVVAAQNASSTPCTNPHLDVADQSQPPNLSALPHINGVVKLPLLNANLCSALPPPVFKANYGLNNAPRIGVQIGHYKIDQLPDDLASLRGQTGGSGGGIREVDMNQNVAERVAAILTERGATVDILPATVPDGYAADAFVAIHADSVTAGNPRGYKLARSRFSAIPQTDDALLNSMYVAYGADTGMPTDSSITRNMTGYYAFNARNRIHTVSKITLAVIIEMGFLTNAADREVLVNRTDAVAAGIADGIWNFIQHRPPLVQREKPVNQAAAIEAVAENTPIYNSAGSIIAYVSKGQRFEYFDKAGSNYSVYVPLLHKPGFVHKSDVVVTTVPR